jgi:hypothetical protein
MAKFVLHYAGSEFELPDRASAQRLINTAEDIIGAGKLRRELVQLAGGREVTIFIGPATQLAVSEGPETPTAS